jgi:hypothetical protein
MSIVTTTDGYSADPDSARRWCSFARMSSGV